MASLLGTRKPGNGEREPLLPVYNDDTTLQYEVHKKLHTYQMLRALSAGFMPSTEQVILNLRTFLASDGLNPDPVDLSESGRLLVKYVKQWLHDFMDLLQHKNGDDQIQDFVWYLAHSKVSVDLDNLQRRAAKTLAKADTIATYKSLQTVGNLLLTNCDFRIFLSDLSTIAREVFKDSALTLSKVAKDASKQLEPSEQDKQALTGPDADAGPAPSGEELAAEVTDVSRVVGKSALKVVDGARESLQDKLSGQERETLINRLKQAVLKLRKRPDYSDSVSTLSLLLTRYAKVYSTALKKTVDAAQEDVHASDDVDRAGKNFWTLLSSFGDMAQWEELEASFKRLLDHTKEDRELEELISEVAKSLQALLTDPSFLDHADEKLREVKEKVENSKTGSSIREDIDQFLRQLQSTVQSVVEDDDISKLLKTTSRIVSDLSPAGEYVNKDLLSDSTNVFIPILIKAIQYIPIPRVEVSTPEVDLLLENIIIEPGETVNHSSFLPYKLRLNTNNDTVIRKSRTRIASATNTTITLHVDGLSVKATDIGYWMKAHSGILRLADAGIASFSLDEKGLDLSVTFDITRNQPNNMLTLRSASATIHKLRYSLRRSKFSFLAWIFGPLVRPLIRRTLEKQIASAVADGLRALNTELVFARERLRATRIADPQDLATFVRAVAARWVPEDDPDLYTRVGIDQPGEGVFKGVYAPGSVVKLWHEEAAQARDRIEDVELDYNGWRNTIFDV